MMSPCARCKLLGISKMNSYCYTCEAAIEYDRRVADGFEIPTIVIGEPRSYRELAPPKIDKTAEQVEKETINRHPLTRAGTGYVWRPEEIEFLRKNYRSATNSQIGESLGRSAKSVATKLNYLGLRRRKRVAKV